MVTWWCSEPVSRPTARLVVHGVPLGRSVDQILVKLKTTKTSLPELASWPPSDCGGKVPSCGGEASCLFQMCLYCRYVSRQSGSLPHYYQVSPSPSIPWSLSYNYHDTSMTMIDRNIGHTTGMSTYIAYYIYLKLNSAPKFIVSTHKEDQNKRTFIHQ